ncbi:hypothetical protein J4441_01430 [Candidatus Micrarchaeota archaeon]|nr:hypothetical protein [Candidatus Micrarchaeota archaeon]
MLKLLEDFFARAHGRKIVAAEMLRLGMRVDPNGRIYFGSIETPPAKIARALGIDRRVVIETAKDIAEDARLLQIFSRLQPRAFIADAAKSLGCDAIIIRAEAKKKDIVYSVTKVLSQERVLIRQIVTDDPYIYPDPVLTIIIDGHLRPQVIKKLRELSFADSITIK